MSRTKRDCQVAPPRNGMVDPISVLLVDDNATFLRVATRFLQEHCQEAVFVVGTAEGGEEALDLAKDLKPRIILLDLIMPGMSGLETIPQLRQAFPEVGIIALTLLDTESYRSVAIVAGADDFVPKAALNLELLPAIKRIIAEYNKRGAPMR